MPTPDKLKEAFEAWHRAVDEHVDMMRSVTAGQPFDAEAMTQKVGEIDSLHGTWMDMVMQRDEATG
jgi:hypothetical protein